VSDQQKYFLDEKDLPQAWYNIIPDLPAPLPPYLHPATNQPTRYRRPSSPWRWCNRSRARALYRDSRRGAPRLPHLAPSPLVRARNLEKALDTPARIYFKNESSAPPAATSPTPPSPRPTTTRPKG